nr:MAG TPA: Group XII secretory phospholipase A2 precursor (PLA2G12) [Caudoviricetes sp.]
MSKGCGCQSGAFRWFKPPYAKLFYAACCIHDDDYDRGGSESDRKAADVRLFRNCYRKIAQPCTSPTKTLWLVLMALCYYWGVRLLGHHHFNYHP